MYKKVRLPIKEFKVYKRERSDVMSATVQERRRLDFSKITFSKKTLSMEEALKDVTPIQWTEDVLSGKRKVIITKAK